MYMLNIHINVCQKTFICMSNLSIYLSIYIHIYMYIHIIVDKNATEYIFLFEICKVMYREASINFNKIKIFSFFP